MDWPAASGRGPDTRPDDMALRRQDQFQAILRRPVRIVEQHVLRASTDVDCQNPVVGHGLLAYASAGALASMAENAITTGRMARS